MSSPLAWTGSGAPSRMSAFHGPCLSMPPSSWPACPPSWSPSAALLLTSTGMCLSLETSPTASATSPLQLPPCRPCQMRRARQRWLGMPLAPPRLLLPPLPPLQPLWLPPTRPSRPMPWLRYSATCCLARWQPAVFGPLPLSPIRFPPSLPTWTSMLQPPVLTPGPPLQIPALLLRTAPSSRLPPPLSLPYPSTGLALLLPPPPS